MSVEDRCDFRVLCEDEVATWGKKKTYGLCLDPLTDRRMKRRHDSEGVDKYGGYRVKRCRTEKSVHSTSE